MKLLKLKNKIWWKYKHKIYFFLKKCPKWNLNTLPFPLTSHIRNTKTLYLFGICIKNIIYKTSMGEELAKNTHAS